MLVVLVLQWKQHVLHEKECIFSPREVTGVCMLRFRNKLR